jgi:hypothetical protein
MSIKKVIKKTIKSAVDKINPEWNRKVMVSSEELIEAMQFFYESNIPVSPIAQAVLDKLKAGGVLTLDDQRIIVRFIIGSIAMNIHKIWADPLWKDIKVECAENLMNANKVGK